MTVEVKTKGVGEPGPADCDGRPVLMIVDGHTIDSGRMQAYSDALTQSGLYKRFGGYYLNSPRPIEAFEGPEPDARAVLVVRFPSLASARAFWNSDQYQNEIKPLRQNPDAGRFTVRVYREVDVPEYAEADNPLASSTRKRHLSGTR